MTVKDIKLNRGSIDFSDLVGRQVGLKTEQFQNKLLKTRVVAISDNSLVIDRSGSSGLVGQLIPGQKIQAEFVHKGQPASFETKIVCPNEGRMVIPIPNEIKPRHDRKFIRYDMESEVQLAMFDEENISAARLNKLKWLKTLTCNISGGGMLVLIPGIITDNNYMILHLPLIEVELPKLIVGRTRYFIPGSAGKNQVGVEFIIREDRTEKLPRTILRNLPEQLFEFDAATRQNFCEYLNNMNTNPDKGDIG